MVAANPISFDETCEQLTHDEVCRIAERAAAAPDRVVRINLGRSVRATTDAFAQLIVLRRLLVRQGRDLALIGLRGPAAALHEICRLGNVLPCLK